MVTAYNLQVFIIKDLGFAGEGVGGVNQIKRVE